MTAVRSFCLAVATLAAITVANPEVHAQELRAGDRIRIKTASGQIGDLIGVYRASEPDYLVMSTGESARANIPWDDVSRLQLSRGEHSNAGKGALIGVAIGGGLGLVLGIVAVAQGDQESGWLVVEAPSVGEAALGALTLGALGAGVGALIGLASKSESWETVPREKWQIQVAPDPKGGVALSINLRL